MPVIICTKFQINQAVVALSSGVWDKHLPCDWEKLKMPQWIELKNIFE